MTDRRSLFIQRPTPGARTDADHAGEDPGQVTLIGEAAGQRHLRQRQAAVAQFLLGHLDAARQQPVMRRYSDGAAEGAREMAQRRTALHDVEATYAGPDAKAVPAAVPGVGLVPRPGRLHAVFVLEPDDT